MWVLGIYVPGKWYRVVSYRTTAVCPLYHASSREFLCFYVFVSYFVVRIFRVAFMFCCRTRHVST